MLGGYRHELPLQLGDFVPAENVNATHWKRPFACGGAGTVLSRAALGELPPQHAGKNSPLNSPASSPRLNRPRRKRGAPTADGAAAVPWQKVARAAA